MNMKVSRFFVFFSERSDRPESSRASMSWKSPPGTRLKQRVVSFNLRQAMGIQVSIDGKKKLNDNLELADIVCLYTRVDNWLFFVPMFFWKV